MGCPRAYEYAYKKGLQTTDKSNALERGGIVHQVVSHALKKLANGQEYLSAIAETLTEATPMLASVRGGSAAASKIEDMIEATLMRIAKEDISFSEVGFSYFATIAGIDSHVWIIPDVIVRRPDGWWIGEIKTTERYDTRMQRIYYNEPQPWFYAHVYELLNGWPSGTLRGVLLYVATPSECKVEEIHSTPANQLMAAEFLTAGAIQLQRLHSSMLPLLPFASKCISFTGSCPYLPLCQARGNPNYHDDLMTNLFISTDPDERWPKEPLT